MKPIARFDFQLKTGTFTRYVLMSHAGADIPDFPAKYKRGNGEYIEFSKNTNPPIPNHRFFEYGFYLGMDSTGKHRRLTGVNFSTSYPKQTFGDSKNIGRNDALLFEFSSDMQKLTVYFFENQAANAETLFEKWTAGELCMTVDTISAMQKESPNSTQGA